MHVITGSKPFYQLLEQLSMIGARASAELRHGNAGKSNSDAERRKTHEPHWQYVTRKPIASHTVANHASI